MNAIMDPHDFWAARPWLRYIYEDAKYRRLSPFGLLLAVMARFSALTPPNVTVRVAPHNRPMTLNLNVVLVGRAGEGKGETITEAEYLLPTPADNRMKPIKLKTGEGVVDVFVKRTERRDENGRILKGDYETAIQTDRGLIRLTEVTDLRTAFAGEGSTVMGTLLAAFSGEMLGGNTRSAKSNVTLPRNCYRLSALIAAQQAGCTREPVLAWRVSSMASAGGKMLAAYARLSGDDAVVVGDGRECREIVISTYDASLGMGHGPTTPPDPLMTEEFGVGMCLLDFAHHARRYHYDAAGIVRLADEVDPSSPFGPWADVARELGVAHE